jgi:uncharacterized membrane protein
MRLPWQKPREFFTSEQQGEIVTTIKEAEVKTSGEIRLFIESKCRYMDALDRAKEIFAKFQMQKTSLRNAVLIYIAMDDHQVAVFGDDGIHEKVGAAYWQEVVNKMVAHFSREDLAGGIITAIDILGSALYEHFPYKEETDKNELPDDIIFGR